MAGKTYVLSDLHGNFKILLEMLKKIDFDDSDELWILGDCNDRGPKTLDIYFYLDQHKNNIHLIRGNHEIMMRDAMIKDDPTSPQGRMWNQNGGLKTKDSYHQYLKKNSLNDIDYQIVRSAFYRMIINMVNNCPSYVEKEINGKKFVLIHAGINPEKDLYDQTEEECAWMREWFYMSPGLEGKTIIFGHTPTCHIHGVKDCFDVWYDPVYEDKIGIDGGLGSFAKGQLNCICLDTMEVFVIKKADALDDIEEEE